MSVALVSSPIAKEPLTTPKGLELPMKADGSLLKNTVVLDRVTQGGSGKDKFILISGVFIDYQGKVSQMTPTSFNYRVSEKHNIFGLPCMIERLTTLENEIFPKNGQALCQ